MPHVRFNISVCSAQLATLSFTIGVCSAVSSGISIEEINRPSSSLLATAWAAFIIIAGVRHLVEKDHISLFVVDIWCGVQLLVVAWLP